MAQTVDVRNVYAILDGNAEEQMPFGSPRY
jgi:hypothetical protein